MLECERPSPARGPPAKTPGGPRAPSAVLVISPRQTVACGAPAASRRAARRADRALLALDRARLATQNEDIRRPLVPASDAQPAGWKPPPLRRRISPPDSRPSSFERAVELLRQTARANWLVPWRVGAPRVSIVPDMLGAVEVAAASRAARTWLVPCLSRWRTKDDGARCARAPLWSGWMPNSTRNARPRTRSTATLTTCFWPW